jgi:hypothetical protein
VYLIGEFHEKEAVVASIRKLKAYGIGPDSMDLFSDEPVELPRGVLDRPTSMSLAGVWSQSVWRSGDGAFIWWTEQLPPAHRRYAGVHSGPRASSPTR